MREGSSLFRHYRSLRLPLSPKTQKSTENRCFFHALTEIRCRQNFPFFLTGETQHIDMPYLEVPVRFNMPIYAFLHNVLLVRKLNPHTKLQCSKTCKPTFFSVKQFNIHTKLQCSKTSNRGASKGFVNSGNFVWLLKDHIRKIFIYKNFLLGKQFSFSMYTFHQNQPDSVSQCTTVYHFKFFTAQICFDLHENYCSAQF